MLTIRKVMGRSEIKQKNAQDKNICARQNALKNHGEGKSSSTSSGTEKEFLQEKKFPSSLF